MDEYDRQIIADSEKEVRPDRSCGYQLSAKQLTELRKVGQDALDQAQTPGEKRVLARINERLANLGNGPLSIRQEGCVDIPLGSGDPRSPDVWVNE